MVQHFPCSQCSAALEFEPGTTNLTCPYCGTSQAIPQQEGTAVHELDFEAALETAALEEGSVEVVTARCRQCSAESTLAPNVVVQRCPFCDTPLSAAASSKRLLRPETLLPFGVPLDRARGSFRQWAGSLWFAPSRIVEDARTGAIDGVYLPFWTFDCETTTGYRGERGDDTRVTRPQTVVENGRSVTRQREEVVTHWSPRTGTVVVPFDDVLVTATSSLPSGLLQSLEPWDLDGLVPFEERYLTGFRVESWSVPLPKAFESAKRVMADHIASVIRKEIGGDHQRIHAQSTEHAAIRFKHVLLPVWVSSYRHGGRVFRFVVNARTGEVQGERPWSVAKLLLLAMVVIMAIVLLVSLSE